MEQIFRMTRSAIAFILRGQTRLLFLYLLFVKKLALVLFFILPGREEDLALHRQNQDEPVQSLQRKYYK